jgi:hypothetical protein
MSRFQSTLLPQLKDTDDRTEAGKLALDLLAKINQVSDDVSPVLLKVLTAAQTGNAPYIVSIGTGSSTVYIPAAYLKAQSGGPYQLTIKTTTAGSSTVVIPIGASTDTILSGALLFDIYVDSSGNVTSKDWSISGSNANGNYEYSSDGILTQRGVFPGGTTSGGGPWTTSPFFYLGSVTLPISFLDTSYSLAIIIGEGSSTFQWVGYLHTKTASTFSNYIFNNQSAPIAGGTWTTIGIWK